MIRFAIVVCVLAVIASGNVTQAEEDTTKLPIPDVAAQNEAVALIAKLYRADYEAAKTPKERSALAKKLLDVGLATKDDPTARYVLFRLGKDIAADAGDAETSLLAVSRIDRHFVVDVLALKAGALARVVESLKDSGGHQQLAPTIQRLIDEAVQQDRFDLALTMIPVATKSAREARSGDLVKQVAAKEDEIAALKQEYEKTLTATAKLESSPTDLEANLVVGRYRCFYKGEWQTGLPMLALGDDEQLKSLAVQELADEKNALAIGDAWWDYSEKVTGKAQSASRNRASQWYAQALPGLSGLTKVRVASRLEGFQPDVPKPEPRQPSPLNLLSKVEAARDAKSGVWVIDNGSLIAKKDKFGGEDASLLLPYEFPGNFDLMLQVETRKNGRFGVGPVTFNQEASAGFTTGIDLDGKYTRLFKGRVLPKDKPAVVSLFVRGDLVEVRVGNAPIFRQKVKYDWSSIQLSAETTVEIHGVSVMTRGDE